jgi:hypothetical protein
MSYAIFKINMYFFMKFPPADRKPIDFAKKLTQEYDSLIQRGGETLSKVSVSSGNTELMETLVNLALIKQSFTTDDTMLDDIGEAIKGYWVGATLNNFPIPPIPAPGSFQNQTLDNSFVTNVGTWTPSGFMIKSNSVLPFINKLIQFIKLHLLTIQGQFLTTSLYPGFPQVPPAPGVLPWQGYIIPDIPIIIPNFKRNEEEESNSTNAGSDEKSTTSNLQERLQKTLDKIEEEEDKVLSGENSPSIIIGEDDTPMQPTPKSTEELRRSIMKQMQDLRCCDCD